MALLVFSPDHEQTRPDRREQATATGRRRADGTISTLPSQVLSIPGDIPQGIQTVDRARDVESPKMRNEHYKRYSPALANLTLTTQLRNCCEGPKLATHAHR